MLQTKYLENLLRTLVFIWSLLLLSACTETQITSSISITDAPVPKVSSLPTATLNAFGIKSRTLEVEPKRAPSNWSHFGTFSPNGKMAASVGSDYINLWDIEKEISRKLNLESVVSVDFSPNGKTLASATWNKSIIIWDTKSGEKIKTLFNNESSIVSIAYSSDGKTLAWGTEDGKITFYNFSTDTISQKIIEKQYLITSLAFSPNSKFLASGSVSGNLILWDAENGTKLKTLLGHNRTIQSIAFSPDEKMLASGADNVAYAIVGEIGDKLAKEGLAQTVFSWSVETGWALKNFSKHTAGVKSVAFSPNQKILATGSTDGTINLWDLEKEKLLKTLGEQNQKAVLSIKFSQDSKTLFSLTEDESVTFWNVSR